MRKISTYFIVLLSTVLLYSCDNITTFGNLSFQNDGIYLKVNTPSGKQTIRLQVIDQDIIRVTASDGTQIKKTESLMSVASGHNVNLYEVIENDNDVAIKTAKITAKVNKHTGEIIFYDATGNIILAEQQGGGKGFKEEIIGGKKLYNLSQVFESPSDEGFYGLGQHQADEFNYKGRNEELFQYNTKVSVPFVISTKNYGILWDNNSLSRFGNPSPYQQLNKLNLFDKEGKAGALTATYMLDSDRSKIFTTRPESTIDYENLETIKNFPKELVPYGARVQWEGDFVAPKTGKYHFILYYAGYTTVSVDGKEVVAERWRTAWNPNSYKFSLDLKEGERHSILIDWKPDGGVSYIGLKLLEPRPEAEQEKLSLWSEAGHNIDYYFINGESMDDVISGYRQVTGKSQIMPKWAMGYWLSRERYKTQYELMNELKEHRKQNIPIDNIVQDWSYWAEDSWGSHKFDEARFPDPKAMIDSVHALDARIMISVWPKFYHTTDNYKELAKNGWMYELAVQDSIRDWIGKGYIAGFYDAYSADARKLFWKQMSDNLYSLGMDAWWMDASEPDVLSNASIEYRKNLMSPTALGPGAEYFNAYSLVNAEAIYNGQRGENPNDRVFLLTRSGFAGLQRYSTATWSGDIGTRWEDMKSQISAGLNFAMSGIPYWTQDIGGFCVERRYEQAKEGTEDMNEWRELNARWFQFGAFCPLFRSHGQYPFREIYNIAPKGHPAYNSMVYYTNLRYKLMPYIYTLASKTWFNDYTIMRAMVMDFGYDQATHNIGDQFMFGPSILVAPVYEYKSTSRKVYLPENSNWYDFESGEFYTGGQTITAKAPYERIPLFVKAGSIIPMGDVIQNTKQQQKDLTIRVYTGKDAKFSLYEDDGVSYNYEDGKYSNIEFNYDNATETLTIGARSGSFDGMPSTRNFTIEFIPPTDSKTRSAKVAYNGSEVTIKRK